MQTSRAFTLLDSAAPSALRPPLTGWLELLFLPLNAERQLGIILCLSFIPFLKFAFTDQPSIWLSLIQGAPQIALILFSYLIAAFYLSFEWQTLFAVFAIACIGISQLWGVANSPTGTKNFMMPVTFVLLMPIGIFARSLFSHLDPSRRGPFVARISKYILAIMSVELATRIAFSPFINVQENINSYGFAAVNDDWFYRYKQSIFFSDANSVGIALLCLSALLLTFRNEIPRRQLALTYVLILATFSRASIIAAALQLVIVVFWRRRRWIVALLAIVAPIVLIRLVSWYLEEGSQTTQSVDASFLSKLYILSSMIDIFGHAGLLQRLCGIGSGNMQYLTGIAAHDIIVAFIVELGLAGSCLFLFYIWMLARKSPSAIFILLIPLLVNGFSLFLTTIPYVYTTLGIIGSVTLGVTAVSSNVSARHDPRRSQFL